MTADEKLEAIFKRRREEKEKQKKRIQKQREAAKEKGRKSAKKLSPKLVESTKKKRESWILPEGEEKEIRMHPSLAKWVAKRDKDVATHAPQFKKGIDAGLFSGVDHSLKYRGEAPKRDTGSPNFYPSDPGAREKISNQTFRKAAGDRIKRLRHERAIMQSRPTLEQGTERWQKRPDSEEMHEQYMDMSGTEKQLGDEEMPGLMNLYETDRDARIKRADEYKQFSDDAKLSAQERARRGEKPIIEDVEGSEELLRESLPHTRAFEREKMEALRRKHDRGIIGGGEAIDLSDPKYSGKRTYGGPHVGTDIEEIMGGRSTTKERKEELEGKSIPYTVGGKKLDLDDPENRKLKEDLIPQYKGGSRYRGLESVKGGRGEGEQNYGMDSEALADLREDQASEIQAQQDMQNMSTEEQDQVIQTVQDQMGPQSEQAIAAKEATGRYVRYEGSGFVINKSKLDKAFDRQRKMKMLQHIPEKARASMLYKWGFIDKEDLNEAQQQSAKEIADLNLTNVRIEQIKQSMEKQKKDMNKKEMSKPDQVRYSHLSTGYIKALSDKNWDLAKELAAQAKDMGYAFSGSSVDQLQKNTANAEIKAFEKLPKYKQMTKKYGDTLVNQFLRYKEKLMTQTTPPVGKKGAVNDIFQIPLPAGAQVDGDTYGDFLRARGYDSFENISKSTKAKKDWARRIGVPVEKLSEQRFNTYVFPEIRKLMLAEVYGSVGMELEDALSLSVAQRVDELDDRLNNPEQNPSITPTEPDAPDAPDTSAQIQSPTDAELEESLETEQQPSEPFTGTPEEASAEAKRRLMERQSQDEAEMDAKISKQQLNKMRREMKEMDENFDDVAEELGNMDVEKLQEALELQQRRLGRDKWDNSPSAAGRVKMTEQMIKYIRALIAQKGR